MDENNILARRYLALLAVGVGPFLLNGWINSLIFQWAPLYWSVELLLWVVLPVLVFRRAFGAGLRWHELGITRTLFGRELSVLRLLGAALVCCVVLLIDRLAFRWFQALLPDPGLFNYPQVGPADASLRPLFALYMALSAGIVEELYYRGLAFHISRLLAWPRLAFLAAMPLLFAAAHWENGVDALLATWVIGLAYGCAYLWLRNLLPLIVVHVLSDYFVFN